MCDSVKLSITGISKTSTQDTDTSISRYTGEIKEIIVDVSGTSPDFDLDVVLLASGSRPETTLFSKDNITADATYAVRQLVCKTDGTAATDAFGCFHAVDQQIQIQTANATGDSQNVAVYVIID